MGNRPKITRSEMMEESPGTPMAHVLDRMMEEVPQNTVALIVLRKADGGEVMMRSEGIDTPGGVVYHLMSAIAAICHATDVPSPLKRRWRA